VTGPSTSSGASGLFPDDRPDIEADDWSDQDLLTKDEARLRLEHSLYLAEKDLASAVERGDGATAASSEDQIGRIRRVLANLA